MNERTHGVLRFLCRVLVFALVLGLLAGCGGTAQKAEDDIIILFTNDVHCGIEDGIGYAGLAAYKKLCEAETPYVTLVDCGDAIQGDAIGTLSKGEYLTDIMNTVGYDVATFGNHEFDYGMEQLKNIVEKAEFPYVCCNLTYNGAGENALAEAKDHVIFRYGEVDVAFIGVTTPETLTSSTPAYFMEDGKFVYGFSHETAEDFYAAIQADVDECKTEGAEYVVLLSHLGEDPASAPFTSMDVVRNVKGLTAVLDGHSHTVSPMHIEKDKEGKAVPICSTGTKLSNIGRLTISPSGTVSTTLINAYGEKDADTKGYIDTIKAKYNDVVEQVVGHTDYTLSVSDENGIRLVRTRETAIGNLCADAYRDLTGAQIALVNGGGIRADLTAGDITYGDIIAVHPFGNYMCMAEATGQEILDSLEIASRNALAETSKDGMAIGEDGSFQHVSGLKYTIDTSIPSTVEMDADGMFVKVGGARRVKDVQVQKEDGSYEPIDPKKTYTVASHNYLMKDNGGGINVFSDNKFIISAGMSDYQVLITYITEELKGDLSAYKQVEGRITVK